MVRLTTARYYTPSGRSIQAKGITPDIVVERAKVVADAQDPFTEVHESDLKGALKNPDGSAATPEKKPDDSTTSATPDDKSEAKPAEKTGDKTKDKPKLQDDYQLLRAVDVLQGIALYKKDGEPATTEPKSAPAKETPKKPDFNR